MGARDLVEEIRARFPNPTQIEDAIQHLKDIGIDRGDAIVIIQRAYGLNYGQSKIAVHRSIAWAADRAIVDKVHDILDDSI